MRNWKIFYTKMIRASKKTLDNIFICLNFLFWFLFSSNRKKTHKVFSAYKYGGIHLCWEMAKMKFAHRAKKYDAHKNQLSKKQSEYLISKSKIRPLISIVVPVYKVATKWLEKCINSAVNQHYNNWELVLVDDASDSQQLTALMRSRALQDERIRMYALEENSGIAAATNFGIKRARGKFVGFLDHDDELTPDALAWVVWSLNKNPDALWLYSDEDLITTKGKCHNPHYKPDFSPEHLLSHMFICHFSVCKTNILKQIGCIRQGYDGAQDHDLALRLSEIIPKEKVIHIPRVLYHWRTIPSSAASNIQAKPKASLAGIKGVSDALKRRNIKGDVTSHPLCPTLYQVKLKPQTFPKVAIIIPTKNSFGLLKRCVESIKKHTNYPNYEIIVIDNQSDDSGLLGYLHDKKNKIKVIKYDKPFNHSEMNNVAVETTNAEFIVFMNNDIEIVTQGWLNQLVATITMDKTIAVVGCLLLYRNDKVQHGGIILGLNGLTGHSHQCSHKKTTGYNNRLCSLQELSAVTAALQIVRVSSFIDAGRFNSNRYPALCNDVDLCLRLKAKEYRCLYNPMVQAIHHESSTRPINEKDYIYKKRLLEDYKDKLKHDPFYNPNLSLTNENFIGFRDFPITEQIPELT